MEEKKLNIYEKLMNVQQELKCNKGQYNSFGKYKYRSCEDILESVKPLLKKYNLILTLSDTLEYIGDRYYIKAIAKITDTETPYEEFEELKAINCITNVAYAREELEKKGMDGSQITGTASSYARKYALNGLLAIDDTKDADTDEFKNQTTEEEKATKEQIDYIKEQLATYDMEEIEVKDFLKKCGKKKLSDLSKKEAAELIGE